MMIELHDAHVIEYGKYLRDHKPVEWVERVMSLVEQEKRSRQVRDD